MATFEDYKKMTTPKSNDPMSVNWWGNKPKYAASMIKAFYPDVDLETGYAMMPKLDAHKPMYESYWLGLFDRMKRGAFQGVFAWGMNPTCGGANAQKNREALGTLDWLVNVNLFENETSSFWKGPGMDPAAIKTEVFFLPCAASYEKEGSVVNSGRWQQWRYRGPHPYGQTKPDGDIMLELAKDIRALYAKEGGAFPDPVLKLNIADWDDGHEYAPDKVAKLMNGYFLKDTEVNGKKFKKGQQVPGFGFLADDGSTTSGCWVMCGAYTDAGNLMKRRDKNQTPEQANIGLFPSWSWAWPMNRRILYNRAGVDKTGKPWNPKKAVIQWKDGKWAGDVPDGGGGPGAKHPFIMQTHGFGQIFGPGRVDGPFPEHYEPFESPLAKHPFSKQRTNPTVFTFEGETFSVDDPKYPYICTTYRVTEHWQTGLMTRRLPWLVEMEPQIFCEMNPKMAASLGIKNGEMVTLTSRRGKLDAPAMVTARLRPMTVLGKEVHIVGIPWHFGWMVPKDGGDSANLLTPSVGEPNTGMPETKAFMVNVAKKAKG
jgi:formate dehydrogenase major subunit